MFEWKQVSLIIIFLFIITSLAHLIILSDVYQYFKSNRSRLTNFSVVDTIGTDSSPSSTIFPVLQKKKIAISMFSYYSTIERLNIFPFSNLLLKGKYWLSIHKFSFILCLFPQMHICRFWIFMGIWKKDTNPWFLEGFVLCSIWLSMKHWSV